MPKWFIIKSIIAAFSLSANIAVAQPASSNLLLLQQQQLKKNESSSTSPSKKSIGFFYRQHIHAQLGTQCFFEQNCLEFSKASFRNFGLIKGFFLSVDRVGRCNGISRSEILPARISSQNLIIETASDYRIKP